MKTFLGALLIAAAFQSDVKPAVAGSPFSQCVDVSIPKAQIENHHGSWRELSHNEWEFLRGIYAMNPQTPPGLPYGDKAVLAQISGDSGGLIFFVDGGMACTPMVAPAQLLGMLHDVGTGIINHEGTGL